MANGSEDQSADNNGKEARLAGGRRRTRRRPESEAAPRLSNAVSEARDSVSTLLEEWRDMVEDHPWKALGVALGAGYVVGGGLLTAFTGRLLFGGLRIGFRLAALPLVREELIGLFETVSERGRGETERRHQ